MSSKLYVRSRDGGPTVVSSRRDNFATRLCQRHRITGLGDAGAVGLFPRFVNIEVLEKEADRVLGDGSFDREAEREIGLAGQSPSSSGSDAGVRRARIAAEAIRLRSVELVDVIEPALGVPARREIAGRALQVLTRSPFDVVKFDLGAEDLDLHTELVFGRDVTIAEFGAVRIFRGGCLISNATHFVLRTASIEGNVPAIAKTEPLRGIDLADHAARL